MTSEAECTGDRSAATIRLVQCRHPAAGDGVKAAEQRWNRASSASGGRGDPEISSGATGASVWQAAVTRTTHAKKTFIAWGYQICGNVVNCRMSARSVRYVPPQFGPRAS